LSGKRGDALVAQSKMSRDVGPLKTSQRAHSDVIKLREQESIHEMAAIDCELGIIDRLLGNLQPGWSRAQKSADASPIEFGFQFLRARDQVRQIEPKQIVAFDHIGIVVLDQTGHALDRASFRFLRLFY